MPGRHRQSGAAEPKLSRKQSTLAGRVLKTMWTPEQHGVAPLDEERARILCEVPLLHCRRVVGVGEVEGLAVDEGTDLGGGVAIGAADDRERAQLHGAHERDVDDQLRVVLALDKRRHVEPLLLRHHVDVVMVGHQHSYERTCRVRNGTCVGTDGRGSGGGVEALHGIVHITAGSAGAGVEKCGFARDASFSLVHSNQWGYLRGRATRQNFSIEFVSDALGTAWDEVVLQR